MDYSWAFYGGGAIWQASQGNLTAQTNLTVPAGENGELRIFTLNWNGEEKLEGELLIYLEPMLSKEQDYRAHPVFSKLFLESTQVENGVVFRRRPRGGERHPQLAILWEGEQVTYTTARELALGRGGLRAILSRKSSPLGNEGGEQTDPCLMVRIPVSLNSGEVQSVRLALSASDHMTSALEGAKRILWGGGGENRRLTALAHRLKLDDGDIDESFHLLSQLVAHQPTGDLSQSALWQFGISGDLPIALATVTDSQEGLRHCAQHQLLAHCGYHFDLVLLVDEGGDYRQPVATALREGLSQPQRLGTKGGIHILASGGEILHQWGCVALPLEEKNHRPDQLPPPPVSIQQGDVQWHYNDKNQVVIQTGEKLPPLGWSQILCNPNFGWMTDETGVGYLWAENAREGRLTPWDNDPLAVGGGERITLTIQNRDYAIFADGDGLPCQITYGFGTARWDKMIGGEHLVTEAFVPVDTSRKILVITWSGGLAILRHRQGDDSPLEIEIKRNQKIILETKAGQNTVSTRQITENIPEITATENWWRRRVCAIQVETPDRELNAYLNGWALYQVLACRVFGRTSQYQNGGAYGFRDQLQDVCALLYTHPTQAREQILLAASRQFEEGDVQHWWHPPLGAGVRTRITDDLLWLPYALSRYLEVTGDWDILDQQIPYLTAPPLKQGEQERYDIPEISCKVESLYQHAISAIECFLDRGLGDHGLPLMGAGDWNDGMNRVGARGRGESLWLGWFGGLTLQKFIPICQHSNDQHRASLYEQWAERLVEGGEQGWDGDWYRRGYFDDGTPLGSRHSHQCQIDSLAQSFAVFVQGSDRARARQGIQSAVDALYDGENQLIRLFTPAFTQKGKDAGYIRGYLPGVRENGGQYTHGAVWLARACLMLGDGDGGYQLLKTLLPATHPQQIYRAEPYVLAADVYATQHHPGRAGWSWYTGAAGWYYRTALENLLGIQLKNNILMIQPNLPAGWQNYQINWSVSDKISLKIEIKRGKTSKILLDGQPSPQGVNLSQLTGSHRLEIEILPEEKKL